jgi:hypothetical protein
MFGTPPSSSDLAERKSVVPSSLLQIGGTNIANPPTSSSGRRRAIPTLATPRLASSMRGTAWGLGRGHALGWGGQDATDDPKGSLEAVPRIDDASRDDAIGRLLSRTGESP